MNIILAQLKKDIQCQRNPLILWAISLGLGLIPLMLLRAVAHFYAPDMSSGKDMLGMLSMGGLALACALAAGFGQLLLVPVLVIRIVHEDVLMGTTAFWLTRPIPRKQLLAAKALLIAVLPLPLLLLGGNSVHFGAGEARLGAGHIWTAELAEIAAFAAVSAITSGVREFLTYGLALLFGKGVLSAILENLWMHFHGAGSVFSGAALHLNAPDWSHLCYFAGLSAVFIHQYLTLQTRRSLAMFIAVIVSVSLLQLLFGPLATIPAVR